MTNNLFANFLTSQLEKYSLNLEALAILSGIAATRLQEMLQGQNPDKSEIKKISYALQYDYNELCNGLKVGQINQSQNNVSDFSEGKNKNNFLNLYLQSCDKYELDSTAVAKLTGTSLESIKKIEEGYTPNNLLLKKLSLLFDWNYIEVLKKIKQNSFLLLHSTENLVVDDNLSLQAIDLLAAIQTEIKHNKQDLRPVVAQLSLIKDYLKTTSD